MAKAKRPTKAMYAAIGLTAAESAVVENKLREVFGLLIESPYGSVIVAGEDISRIVVMCKRVARYNKHLSEDDLALLLAIFKSIEAASASRNFLVHAQWFKLNEPGEHLGLRSSRVATSKDGLGTSEGFKWKVSDALAIAEAYTKIADAIDIFIERAFPDIQIFQLQTRAQDEKMNELTRNLMNGWGLPPAQAH